ncbi:Carboxypeptidase regulatory-like domain-containing protein [Flavobacterium resistens]|uniref:Carboxypeptidase regulatory-like domain-containing protein n=1 Tax=Flavobacterium resistens TaxID=443612 RepID=A0A521APS8_9FLAO|nr:TonB-dependent receptor [Flavobacterium resistens]MRX69786.1 TonB-dependent receptor [Flavobacterium resistens]SMO36833.1 Carboxypeptidase regulatory-like domain-containing protein [Flavobacterium resistens]
MTKLKLFFSALMLLTFGSIFAQITTSSLTAKVNDGTSPVIDAEVTLTHLPTNAVYRAKTDKQGRFSFENLNAGGPYELIVKGKESKEYSNAQIQLSLGENDLPAIVLSKEENVLEEVVITSSKPSSKNNGTNISEKQVNGLPLINRGIQDVTKLVPQSSNNSFAGTNFRYNNVTIDGSINNDAIGFSPSLGGQSGTSGMPGSSTRSNSISLDAIQDIQVYIAPYDIKLGNFLGGSVNAVTRSGTNTVSGSIYSYGRSAAITGPNNAGDGSKMPGSFDDYQIGFRLGLPIIKDKLFFFTNMEYAERTDPLFYNAGQTDANGKVTSLIDNATAEQISSFVKTNYGFDPGTYGSYNNFAMSRKYFNKLDWKINDKHSISLRNNTVVSQATNLERDAANFRFSSMDFTQKNQSISTVLELKSHFNNQWSNSFIASYSAIKDYRDPKSSNIMFPQTEIGYNGGTIFLGNDREATVFNMKQNTAEITDNLTFKTGNHTLLFGTHNEFYDINYGFVNSLNGRVSYKSLADFFNKLPTRVRGTYPFDGSTRDEIFNDPYAKFKVNLYSVYAQDEIRIGNKLKVTPGVRVDYTDIPNKPKLSPQVQNSPADPNYGTTYTYTPLSQIKNNFFSTALVSPRFGFTYNVDEDKTFVIRGGSGVFTGRIPFAWLGYAYYNDGVGYGSYDKNNLTPAQVAAAGDPLANGGLNGYHDAVPKVQADLVDNKFKMPAVLRNSLAFDKTINGYKFTVEGIYTKVIRDLEFQQVNKTDNPTYFSYDTKHEMPIYAANINSAFSNAYLLSNTNKGYRYSITEMISKTYDFGFNFMAAYTYGDSRDVTNGIRNSMESNFQMNQSLTPNDPQLATSNFNIKHRIVSNVGYAVKVADNNTFSANVYFNAQSGNPFSWGFVNSTIAGTGQAAGLAYIFKDVAEAAKYIGVSSTGVPSATAAQQVADYEAFINGNDYLKSRRGTFTQRNGDTTPWNIQADLKLMDEIKVTKVGTFQISFSMANVGNLINKDWGRSYFVPNTYNSTASIGLTKSGNLGGVATGDPTYTFQKPTSAPYTVDQLASRFQGQFGVRYLF